jgi:hypothetical protein
MGEYNFDLFIKWGLIRIIFNLNGRWTTNTKFELKHLLWYHVKLVFIQKTYAYKKNNYEFNHLIKEKFHLISLNFNHICNHIPKLNKKLSI